MQPLILDELPNYRGWDIIQDPDTQLFIIKRPSGHKMNNKFTTRRAAQQHLQGYLLRIQTLNKKANAKRHGKK